MIFRDTVTLIRPAMTTDVYGNPVVNYSAGASRESVRGWLRLTESEETTEDGRQAVRQGAVVYLRPGTVVPATSRIVAPDGSTFEALGDGVPARGSAGELFVRVRLRRVTG